MHVKICTKESPNRMTDNFFSLSYIVYSIIEHYCFLKLKHNFKAIFPNKK